MDAEEEFKIALMSMEDDKAPSPDAFNSGFYKRFWDNYRMKFLRSAA